MIKCHQMQLLIPSVVPRSCRQDHQAQNKQEKCRAASGKHPHSSSPVLLIQLAFRIERILHRVRCIHTQSKYIGIVISLHLQRTAPFFSVYILHIRLKIRKPRIDDSILPAFPDFIKSRLQILC